MHDSFDITTVVFAILAVIVVWKLRSVLGARTGVERPPRDNLTDIGSARPRTAESAQDRRQPPSGDSNVIRLGAPANDAAARAAPDPDRWKGFADPGSKVWAGLDTLKAADPSFEARGFVEGAKAAYEMIVLAFAKGDAKTLRPLLSGDVFDSFSHAINDRAQRGETVETTFVSIDKSEMTDVQTRTANAQITLHFVSKLISATRDRAGAVVDGNAEKVVDMIDIWTFARDIGSRDPNWKLVATETNH